MKERILVLVVAGLLSMVASSFAADGDLIVQGKLGVGTTTPYSSLEIAKGVTGNFNAINVYNNVGSPYNEADSVSISLGKTALQSMAKITASNSVNGSYGWGYLAFSTMLGTNLIERMRITYNGNVGIGTTAPTRLLSVGSGGAGSDGAAWFTSSSREYKDHIQELSAEKAKEAVRNMKPVTFNYKDIPGHNHVGFIAEDVPDLIATPDRKSLSAMDIVAVLAKVVQEQQKEIEKLKSDMNMMKEKEAGRAE